MVREHGGQVPAVAHGQLLCLYAAQAQRAVWASALRIRPPRQHSAAPRRRRERRTRAHAQCIQPPALDLGRGRGASFEAHSGDECAPRDTHGCEVRASSSTLGGVALVRRWRGRVSGGCVVWAGPTVGFGVRLRCERRRCCPRPTSCSTEHHHPQALPHVACLASPISSKSSNVMFASFRFDSATQSSVMDGSEKSRSLAGGAATY